jgi:DNA-binding MarR family transcriptional regulator
MPKATTSPITGLCASPSSEAIVQIQGYLQIMSQSMNQVRAHEHLLQAAGVRIDKAGIALLFKLQRHGDSPLRVTDLADLLGVDPPTVTRKVQQLERLGFVIREADAEDGRATRIQLTQEGRDTLESVLVAHREFLARVFATWADKDLKTFASLLERFSETIRIEMEKNRD